jgi:hypothetical protein
MSKHFKKFDDEFASTQVTNLYACTILLILAIRMAAQILDRV